jgi:exosortase A
MNTEVIKQNQLPDSWRNALVTLSLVLFALGAIYWESFNSMVSIWIRSETFTHGFVILPISLLLIWRKRFDLSNISPRPQVKVFVILIVLETLWLMGDLAGVLVVRQFAVVAMIPTLTWLVLGTQVVRVLMFPLAFLFFSIPTFEFLVPVLQDFTAEFTVSALKLLGIPVFWEGRFFHIPTGSFEVAEACSGIRYLIACIALGVLFAYLNYTSWLRRLVFVGLSVVVPIVANGLRALGIVLLAYHTNHEFGRGVDHIIYGWIFFGVVVFLLFWLGSFFREDISEASIAEHNSNNNNISANVSTSFNQIWIAFIGILLLFLPPLSESFKSVNTDKTVSAIELPQGVWSGPYDAEIDWKPLFRGVSTEKIAEYKHKNDTVFVYIGRYSYQSQNAELINSENKFYDDSVWRRVNSGEETISLSANKSWNVNSMTLRSNDKKLLLWYWYEIAQKPTISKLVAKFHESKMQLFGEISNSHIVVLATPIHIEEYMAKAVLEKYMMEMLSRIRSALHDQNANQQDSFHG